MSVRIVQSVEVLASAEVCWRSFSELADWPRWFASLTAVERTMQGPFVVGELLVLGLAFRGHGSRVTVRVASVVDGHEVRWVGSSFGVRGDHAFRVDPMDATRARFTSDETFTGFPTRLIPRRIFAELEAEVAAGLQRFARLVAEKGETQS